MPKQDDLFSSEFYPENSFQPLHPDFTGIAMVDRHSFSTEQPPYKVNLTTGECSCDHGAAFTWYTDKTTDKWITNRYCVHKLKCIADIIEKSDNKENPDYLFPFIKAVATRYNYYEAVSAFHKNLRIGNVEKSFFYGSVIGAHRGAKGIVRYLSNIIYEETRDHKLRDHLVDLLSRPKLSIIDYTRAIIWFCETKKKWDLHEYRYPLYLHEMRGYQRLVKEFGQDVAKGGEIIEPEMVPVFLAGIGKALAKQDYDYLQYCVKGLQKSKFPKGVKSYHQLRGLVVAELMKHTDKIDGVARVNVKRFCKYLQSKTEKIGISYHDLNAFADLFANEPLFYGNLSDKRIKQILRIKKLPVFPFDKFPAIPIVAHDNHTHRGKHLLKKYAAQIPYGVEQTDIDLRGCGAYIGVGWRYIAMADCGTVKCKWHEPKSPTWLKNLVTQLFY